MKTVRLQHVGITYLDMVIIVPIKYFQYTILIMFIMVMAIF